MKKKIILWTMVVMLLMMISLVGGGYYYMNSLVGQSTYIEIEESNIGIKEEVKEELLEYEETVTNILLFGIDAEDGGQGRSDSIMIATIDTLNSEIKLSSIMRDSYVQIQGYGLDKINHAYAFGGPELAMNTINSNFNLNITNFAAVDFSSMSDIVNILGGVELNITSEEVPHISGVNSAGVYTLNGDQALQYSRIRYAEGNDYKRTERQRDILEALFNKAIKMNVTEYPSLLSQFLPLIETNLKTNDILDLANEVVKVGNLEVQQDRFPRDGYCEGIMVNGVYYLSFNEGETIKQMHNFIFE